MLAPIINEPLVPGSLLASRLILVPQNAMMWCASQLHHASPVELVQKANALVTQHKHVLNLYGQVINQNCLHIHRQRDRAVCHALGRVVAQAAKRLAALAQQLLSVNLPADALEPASPCRFAVQLATIMQQGCPNRPLRSYLVPTPQPPIT